MSYSQTQTYTFTVLGLKTTAADPGVVGTPYSFQLVCAAGAAPFVFELVGGSLPNGLSMDDAGSITGTPTTMGTSSFNVRQTDASGRVCEQAVTMDVTVANGPDWVHAVWTLLTVDPPATGTFTFNYFSVLSSGGDIVAQATIPPYTGPAVTCQLIVTLCGTNSATNGLFIYQDGNAICHFIPSSPNIVFPGCTVTNIGPIYTITFPVAAGVGSVLTFGGSDAGAYYLVENIGDYCYSAYIQNTP